MPTVRFAVRSETKPGTTYTVSLNAENDEDLAHVEAWQCTCPARQYHPQELCKHLKQYRSQLHDAWEDQLEELVESHLDASNDALQAQLIEIARGHNNLTPEQRSVIVQTIGLLSAYR